VTDTLVVDDHEIEERFVRASGPGGQNVNKGVSMTRPASGGHSHDDQDGGV